MRRFRSRRHQLAMRRVRPWMCFGFALISFGNEALAFHACEHRLGRSCWVRDRGLFSEPPRKKLSPKAAKKAKLQRQRTGGGDGLKVSKAPKEEQQVRVEQVRRGQKQVTIVRGLEVSLDERKKLLKTLKAAVGGGGTLDEASGVVEVQGSHAPKLLEILIKQGFKSSKQSGKK